MFYTIHTYLKLYMLLYYNIEYNVFFRQTNIAVLIKQIYLYVSNCAR